MPPPSCVVQWQLAISICCHRTRWKALKQCGGAFELTVATSQVERQLVVLVCDLCNLRVRRQRSPHRFNLAIHGRIVQASSVCI